MRRLTRREFLKLGALAALASACAPIVTPTPTVYVSPTPTRTPTATPTSTSTPTPLPKGFPEPPEPIKPKGDFNIGTYYITGWGTFEGKSSDWRLGTPYTPLLGFYKSDDPRTADWHIFWLVENGRNHVMIPSTDPNIYGWNTNFEKGFLKSSLLPFIQFSMMFNNEPYWPSNPWGNDPNKLDELTKNTISYYAQNYFSHPQYRKVDGKPLLTLYHAFIIEGHPELGFDRLQRMVDDIRETVLRYGYEVFLVGDIMSTWIGNDQNAINHAQRLYSLFDAGSSYAVINAGRLPPNEWNYDDQGNVHLIEPYDTMVAGYISLSNWWSEQARRARKVFIPPITPGFDNEIVWKRRIDPGLVKRTNPTPEKYADMIQGIKDFIDPELRMIYEEAFNEYQEGTVIEPTKEFGFQYLNILRDLLYQSPIGGWRPNLVPTKDGKIVVYETGELYTG